MSKTNTHENTVLDILRGQAHGISATYAGLFTNGAGPGEAGGGTEVTDGTPPRVAITWNAASAGSIDNSAVVEWTSWPNASDTVGHVGIFDSLSGGNLLYYADLDTARTITSGETASFAAGALVVTED